jgi:hypothetical protein
MKIGKKNLELTYGKTLNEMRRAQMSWDEVQVWSVECGVW